MSKNRELYKDTYVTDKGERFLHFLKTGEILSSEEAKEYSDYLTTAAFRAKLSIEDVREAIVETLEVIKEQYQNDVM